MSIRSARLLGGRYQLHTVLGRGGMAAVWAGIDTRLDRPIAVKVLDGAALADPAMVRRLEAEAKTLARLAHPNIVAGYDVGTEDGVPYLVMELVEGDNLARHLAGGPLEVAEAVAVAVQICDAVEAAHRAGVVHRDIKPENVLLTPAGAVKVCDFGIARWLRESRAGLTGPAAVIGTSEYMAPEQATGREIDARTDLYAIGCLLYHMLAGRPPLPGEDPLRVMWRHVHESPMPIGQARPGVPAELDALVTQLLAKEPAQRPASAREVRDRLSRVVPTARVPTLGTATEGGTAARRAGVAARTVVTPAATPLTRTMPVPFAGSRFRLGPLGIAGVAVVAALVAAVAVALAMAPRGVPNVGPPGGTASLDPSSAVATSPTASATVETIRAAIAAQVADGQLDRRVAEDLDHIVDDIERRIDHGDEDKAAERVAELRRRLGELRRDDRLSAAGYSAIVAAVDALAATLPDQNQNNDD